MENECGEFVVSKDYTPNRGPTDKCDVDTSPFAEKMRVAIESRVGKATSPQSQMGDVMPDKPFCGFTD